MQRVTSADWSLYQQVTVRGIFLPSRGLLTLVECNISTMGGLRLMEDRIEVAEWVVGIWSTRAF